MLRVLGLSKWVPGCLPLCIARRVWEGGLPGSAVCLGDWGLKSTPLRRMGSP